MTERHLPPARAAAQRETPVLPAGGLRRTSRLAALPLRHAARTAVAATRLSRVAADQVAARTAEQLFGTLGELKGGAAKLGQAMSVLEAAMPEEVAAPYRVVEELDYVREGRVQSDVAAAFADPLPDVFARARAAGMREPPGRTWVKVPAVYAATPRVLITRWLDGVSLSTLLDGRMDLLPEGWRELSPGDAADLAARLLGHAIYAPAACTGWMHADLHPGNFLLLPGGRLGMLDFGAVAAMPSGIPEPFGQLAAAVLAGDGPTAVQLVRRVGALAPGRELDQRLVVELLHPMVATAATDTFTYSRPWLRGLMAHFTEPRFAPALRNLTPPREYALVWRATLSAAGLFAQLGATAPTRGFHLAYSPGFRDGILGTPQLYPGADQAGRRTGTDG